MGGSGVEQGGSPPRGSGSGVERPSWVAQGRIGLSGGFRRFSKLYQTALGIPPLLNAHGGAVAGLGILCAPWHMSVAPAAPRSPGVASAQDVPVHFACTLRTDVFAAARARAMNFGPTSARALARRPLLLPSLKQCEAESA